VAVLDVTLHFIWRKSLHGIWRGRMLAIRKASIGKTGQLYAKPITR